MKFLQKTREKNIFRKIRKGDEGAFTWLYDQYAPKIYRFIYLKTNSSPEAEDLTSEAFLRLWRNLALNPTSKGAVKRPALFTAPLRNPRALLYQIARNLVVDYYRKKPRRELIIDEEKERVFENIPNPGEDLNQKAMLASDLAQIRKALSQIKPEYQELIIWRHLDDFSVKEIAQILEKPEPTVRVQLYRALEALRKALGGSPQQNGGCPR